MEDYGLNESMLQEAPQETQTQDVVQSDSPVESKPDDQLFEYQVNGKTVKEDLNTILKRAGMGYNYAQHMSEFKQKQTELEARMQQAQELESQWKPYHQYAQENPEWASHWKSAYENRFNSFDGQQTQQPFSGQQTTEPNNELMTLKNEFLELKKAYDNDRQTRMVQEQDLELNNQINEVKKQYPDIDFTYTDPSTGKSLEYQVLEHGSTHGINSFKAAFRDFYHDQLVSLAASKAKEAAAKELQQRQQKGFMSTSDTPQLVTKGSKGSLKNMSYEQLIAEGWNNQG